VKLKKNGLLLLVLTLALSLFVAACGGGEETDGTANENDSADATEEENANEAEGTEEDNDGEDVAAGGDPVHLRHGPAPLDGVAVDGLEVQERHEGERQVPGPDHQRDQVIY
jgi:hypothetical protein